MINIKDKFRFSAFLSNFQKSTTHKNELSSEHSKLNFFKYVGPGLLVTVGFIDPGNWASNVAAGSSYGYTLLWMVTLATIMLIVLQHNAAHLGIASGLCMSEAASIHIKKKYSRIILGTAVAAAIATAMAEILGGAIALNMLFKLPLKIGTVIITVFVGLMLSSNSYKKLEKWIIGFVSIIGISFLYELTLVRVPWNEVATAFVIPKIPYGSIPIIMSVLGAVVMPHNLFLHSEIIQSRQWNLENDIVIKKQLKFEFLDTLLSMILGWAINGAMIILAAAAFFSAKINVTELNQAQAILKPLLGNIASLVFAVALLFSGIASSVTAGMAGGSIFAGFWGEPYDINERHTKLGVSIVLISAAIIIFFITDPFKGLVYSQILLSIQLSITIFLQIYLTSSKKVMGKFVNSIADKIILWVIATVVVVLNIMLLINII